MCVHVCMCGVHEGDGLELMFTPKNLSGRVIAEDYRVVYTFRKNNVQTSKCFVSTHSHDITDTDLLKDNGEIPHTRSRYY